MSFFAWKQTFMIEIVEVKHKFRKLGKCYLPISYPVFPPSSKLAEFAMIKRPTKIHGQKLKWICFLLKLDIRI